MDIKQRLQAELNRPDGSTGSGSEIRTLITDVLTEIRTRDKRIEELEAEVEINNALLASVDARMAQSKPPSK